jgi:hypothetical protein
MALGFEDGDALAEGCDDAKIGKLGQRFRLCDGGRDACFTESGHIPPLRDVLGVDSSLWLVNAARPIQYDAAMHFSLM